jgi:hypothetical protein
VRRTARRVAALVPRLDPDAVEAALRREGEHLRALGGEPRRLAAACAWGATNWLLDAAALWVVLAGAGFVADPLELFVAYALAGVLGVLPITPGGLGIVEGVLVPALVGLGAPPQVALVGVLGWRLVGFWLPIPVGVLAWATLRHRPRRPGAPGSDAAPDRDRGPLPPGAGGATLGDGPTHRPRSRPGHRGGAGPRRGPVPLAGRDPQHPGRARGGRP